MVEKVSRELDEIAFSPFEIRLKGMGAFPSLRRIRVVWVRIEEGAKELNDIFMQLESRLRKLGFPPERRGFVPHITIARVKTGRNIPILARCIESFSDFDFGIMKADRLRLKRSVLTPKGPIYSVLHEKVAISR
jgi:2'-5' RNA ligase